MNHRSEGQSKLQFINNSLSEMLRLSRQFLLVILKPLSFVTIKFVAYFVSICLVYDSVYQNFSKFAW